MTGSLTRIEELRDPVNYEAFKMDVARANIFIGSLIFIEDLAKKVVDAVEPVRDNLDAAIVFPSMPEVMRLTQCLPISQTLAATSSEASRWRTWAKARVPLGIS